MKLFWSLYGVDAVIALIAVYFFLAELSEGRVGSFNILPWLAILGGLAAILGGGLRLKSSGHQRLATGVLLIPAVPALLFGLFLLLAIILQPRWN